MNKQQLIDSLGLDDATAKELAKHTVADIQWAIEIQGATTDGDIEEDTGDEILSVEGNKVPERFRKKYAERAKEAGRKAHTSSGKDSLNNGDELALLLESATPFVTCAIADVLLERRDGETYAQYTTDRIGQVHPKTKVALKALNQGMVRMNAGNRIRSFCKKSDNPASAITIMKGIITNAE